MRSRRGAAGRRAAGLTALALVMAATLATHAEPRGSRLTISAELGGAAMTNHPTYVLGLGSNLGLGVTFRDRLSLEWMLANYSMRAKDGLHAANTVGRLRMTAVAVRLRLPLLPISVGGGVGMANAPLLVRDDEGMVDGGSVRQLGAFASGALILLRSRAASVYAEGRLFMPFFKEIPPPYYPAQDAGATYPSTEEAAYPLLMLGLGVRVAL